MDTSFRIIIKKNGFKNNMTEAKTKREREREREREKER